MKTLKKIVIWVCIMIALIIGGDLCIHQMLKTSEYKGEQHDLANIGIEGNDIDKDSLLVGFLVFLCMY